MPKKKFSEPVEAMPTAPVEIKPKRAAKAKPPQPKVEETEPKVEETVAEVPVTKAKSVRLTGPSSSSGTLASGGLHFSRQDLRELELSQLRVSSAQQAVELRKFGVDKFVREAQERMRGMEAEVKVSAEDLSEKMRDLYSLYKEIEEAYGISMKEITYDSLTGRIQPAPSP